MLRFYRGRGKLKVKLEGAIQQQRQPTQKNNKRTVDPEHLVGRDVVIHLQILFSDREPRLHPVNQHLQVFLQHRFLIFVVIVVVVVVVGDDLEDGVGG